MSLGRRSTQAMVPAMPAAPARMAVVAANSEVIKALNMIFRLGLTFNRASDYGPAKFKGFGPI